MREGEFQQEYAGMSDDQLRAVVADRNDLVPEAVTALDREVQRRQLGPSRPPQWAPDAEWDDGRRCLEDDFSYGSLQRQNRLLERFWWLSGIPFAASLLSARYAYKDGATYEVGLGCVVLVFAYWLFIKLRIAAYTCPQCARRFGSDANCSFCGFPRCSANPRAGMTEA